jgi:hypothetical protein
VRIRKRIKPQRVPARPGVFKRLKNFVVLVEQLPYGASWLTEKRVARVVLAAGVIIMAFGAALFAVAWRARLSWLGEGAFVITLVGWMMVILAFAFGLVGWAARVFPHWGPSRKHKD